MGQRKKNLILVKVGDTIWMGLSAENQSKLSHCTPHLGRGLHEVQVDGRRLRRNRRQLPFTLESSPVSSSNKKEPHQVENERSSLVFSGFSMFPCYLREWHIASSTIFQKQNRTSSSSPIYINFPAPLDVALARGLWQILNTWTLTWTSFRCVNQNCK